MALSLEEFRRTGRPGLVCGVRRVLDSLDPSDRKVLEAALADPQVQHAAISRVLKGEGHDLAALQIGRHRKGECKC